MNIYNYFFPTPKPIEDDYCMEDTAEIRDKTTQPIQPLRIKPTSSTRYEEWQAKNPKKITVYDKESSQTNEIRRAKDTQPYTMWDHETQRSINVQKHTADGMVIYSSKLGDFVGKKPEPSAVLRPSLTSA